MRRFVVLLAAAPLLAGCGSHFALKRVAPARTVQGSVVVPDQGKAEALRTGFAIAFPSAARGFLATAADTLRRTDDGGRTWKTLAVGFPFISLSFVSTSAGFALATGGNLYATRDAGRSWRLSHHFRARPNGDPLSGTIQFVDARHGWASPGAGLLQRTTDGGISWRLLAVPCRDGIVSASFVDESSGFLVCGGEPGAGSQAKDFYATDDGGQTWRYRACARGIQPGCKSDLPASGYASRLAFADGRSGLLVTDRGGLWRTQDGGKHWSQTLLTDDAWFVASVSWASPRTVFALTMQDGSLIRSDDAGGHWRRVWPAGAGLPPGAFTFSSPRNGIGLGSSRILVPDGISATSDGGSTWHHVAELHDADQAQLVRAGPTAVWTTGFHVRKSGGARYFLLRSGDDGRQWQRRPMPRGLRADTSLSFPTAQVGFAAGAGALFRTDDGGGSWRRVRSNRRDLFGAVFVTPSEGLSAGDSGLFRSGDGGRTWRAVPVRPAVRLSGLFVLDARDWWLESRSLLLRTVDGGRTWTAIRLRGLDLTALDFATPRVGYARAAAGGGLERTTDGGRTWRFVQAG